MSNPLIRSALSDKRVVVMGLGRFGGGLGITRWLIESGADVFVTDPADEQTLDSSIAQLNDLRASGRLEITLGPHDPTMLDDADVLVVNPAVPMPWNNPFIQSARDQGMLVTTEIEIAYSHLDPKNVIAVTGSAGKSTTSAMIHHALVATGRHAILAGNIGGSLLGQLESITDDTVLVIEFSSAMLYWLWGSPNSTIGSQGPKVGCVTNCTSNHIDWHGDQTHYQRSKELLLSVLHAGSHVLVSESLESWLPLTNASPCVIKHAHAMTECTTPGMHNAINAAMALRAVMMFDETIEIDRAQDAIRSFAGLPHRLERCHRVNAITFYNDSKSTVPQATLLAVEAVSACKPKHQIHLIAGGYDKGSDLSSIAALHDQLAGLYTIGATGPSLACNERAIACQTLDVAVAKAYERAQCGDVIILSPGCASWDQYSNYEERGERFVSLVKAISEVHPCSSKRSS